MPEEASNLTGFGHFILLFNPFDFFIVIYLLYLNILQGKNKQIMVSLLLSHNAHFFFLFGLGWRGRGGGGGGGRGRGWRVKWTP